MGEKCSAKEHGSDTHDTCYTDEAGTKCVTEEVSLGSMLDIYSYASPDADPSDLITVLVAGIMAFGGLNHCEV